MTDHPLLTVLETADVSVAANHWEQWRTSIDLDNITYDELLLLPSVHQRWKEHSWLVFDERISGIAKKYFFQNTLYRTAIDRLRQDLDHADVQYHFLRDASIDTLYGTGADNARVIQGIDLWLPLGDIQPAVESLLRGHWKYTKHTRQNMQFSSGQGLRITVHWSLMRHWDEVLHERFIELRKTNPAFLVLDHLLAIKGDHVDLSLQMILDLRHLLAEVTHVQLQTLIAESGRFLLDHRLAVVLQTLGYAVEIPEDQFSKLNNAHQRWISLRIFRDKLRYHLLRYSYLRKHSGVLGFYRYWRAQRRENQALLTWLRTIPDILQGH